MRCSLIFPLFCFAKNAQQLPAEYPDDITDSVLSVERTSFGPCDPEPSGYGPRPKVDSAVEFSNFTAFYTAARIAHTPLGYTLVGQTLNGSVYGTVYRGLEYLTRYDPVLCANLCNEITYCTSFNIYYERDPVVNPSYGGCPNPNSTTNIKCVFWGSSISDDLALNNGELRCDFQVVIAGSNYYTKEDPRHNLTDLGFYGPRGDAPSNAIFARRELIEPTDGYSTSVGYYRGYYTQGPEGPNYDPRVCAHRCNGITKSNRVNKVNQSPYINGAYPKCNMFMIFEDSMVDGVPFSVVCYFFDTSWDSKYSTDVIGTDRKGRNLTATLVKIYQRLDYSDPPICILPTCEDAQYYSGGNCSGWGASYCQHNGTISLWD